jgi:branched-chain amino acid transport system ATP-binding protein
MSARRSCLPVPAHPHRGYVLETDRVVLSGTGGELLANEHVKKAFLGI